MPRSFEVHVAMERQELERELERLHAESWGWALACAGRRRDVAEDALQTAYVRVLSGAARPSGGSSLRTWLFGVIRLTVMEELRRERVADERRDPEATIDAVDPAPRPDTSAEHAERSAALRAGLSTLSPRQREVLQLVFYHGMTIEEAAVVMRVSLGSARTHYERGKKSLAAAVASLQGDLR